MPKTDAITIYRGEDVDLPFTMDPVENITGWTIVLSIKSAAQVVITKTATITSGASGTFVFALLHADSDDLDPGAYHYDVWRTDTASERVLAIGNFYIADVVRDVS